MMKRLISFLLCVVMLLSMLPVQAFAVQDTDDMEATMDSQDVDFEGTNAVGTLLAEAIATEQQSTIVSSEDTPYEDGYTLTEIVVQGSVATVTYDAMEEAQLVVALYSDDGMQLLNTAKTMVSPEETTATVTFSGEMPQYFLASGYLLDVYDYSPLCPSYETPMYTQDIQELLIMTVEDCVEEYGEERIYNLDDSNQTNFGVYAEGVALFYEEAGVNTVASVDDENMLYVFENADERMISLTEGTVVVYEYADGELLLLKVGTASVDGSTVTIQGADMEIEEVFALMKVEASADKENTTFDPEGMEENIEYWGTDAPQTFALENESSSKLAHTFYFWGEEDNDTSEEETWNKDIEAGVDGKGKFEGTMSFVLESELKFFISTKRQYVEYKLMPTIELKAELSGFIYYQTKQLGKGFDIPLGSTGMHARIRPTIKLKYTGKIELNTKLFLTIGFSVAHQSGNEWDCQDLSHLPKLESKLELEGKVFLGFDMNPGIYALSDSLFKADMTCMVGFEMSGKMEYKKEEYTAPFIHDCNACVDGDISIVWKLKLEMDVLNIKNLKLEHTFLDDSYKLMDFFWSLDTGTFDIGECPNCRYRVYVTVKDKDLNIVPNAKVYYIDGKASGGKKVIGTTNANGVVMDQTLFGKPRNVYLPKGSYTFETVVNGEAIRSPKPVEVYTYTSTVMTSSKEYWERQEKLKLLMILPDDVSASPILKSGMCGTNLHWQIRSSGLLEIFGEGRMDNYSEASGAPWYKYKDQIKSVRIGTPPTDPANQDTSKLITVGDYAFEGYTNIKKVILEDNVTSVGFYAFRNCTGLQEIRMPVDLDICAKYDKYGSNPTYYSPFMGTNNVVNIHYTYGLTGKMSERQNVMAQTNTISYNYSYTHYHSLEYNSKSSIVGVYLDEGILDIVGGFVGCSKLKDAAIPSTVTEIGNGAFNGCANLILDQLPVSLTTIGSSAFYGCRSLEKITIPTGVTQIHDKTFYECTGLEELVIPDTVTSLGNRALYKCTGLKKVTMPIDLDPYRVYINSYVRTDESTFEGCTNVQSIHYTYGQTGKMTERTNCNTNNYPIAYSYDWSLEYFSRNALQSITFDSGITEIAGSAFTGCNKLGKVELPSGVTLIGSSAFSGCTNMTMDKLPDDLKSLGSGAFYGCKSLMEKITIPKGVTQIHDKTFYECTGLEELVIPDTVTSLGNRALYKCTGLKKVTMPIDLDPYRVYINSYSKTDESTFEGCTNVESIHYTYGQTGKMTERTNINTNNYPIAYSYDWSLEYFSRNALQSITFDDGIVDIASNAFKSATLLSEICFLGSAPTITSSSFSGVKATALYPYGNETWTESVLQNYGGTLTWTPYILDGDGNIVTEFDLVEEESETAETAPEETEPAETEPEETEPEETEPAETEPAETEPVETEPVETEPVETEPVETEPVETEPVETEPVETEPVETEPAETVAEAVSLSLLSHVSSKTQPAKMTADVTRLSNVSIPKESAAPARYTVSLLSNVSWEPGAAEPIADTSEEDVTPSASTEAEATAAEKDTDMPGLTVLDVPVTYAIYGGMNEAEFDETGAAIQHASFSGLVAGAEYTIFALESMDVADLLDSDNILHIDQAPADENGELEFRYIQRIPADHFNVFVTGASHRHLKNATISFPKMRANGEMRIVEPTVTYDGEILVEGVDYVVMDGQGTKDAGDHLCTIRGICNYTGLITCSYSMDEAPEGAVVNRISIATEDLNSQTSIWVDGMEYSAQSDADGSYVDLPDSNAKTMVTYTYGESNGKPYPIGMKVWTLSNTDGFYTATRVEELDNALQYEGCSIRIKGKQGIRMITSVDKSDKKALMEDGLAGYTLKEYGTAIAWAGQLSSKKPLVLGKSYVSSNYAYKKGEADPIYHDDGERIHYTNVIVGFTMKQCSKDLAMRPYMILEDAEGNAITIYGGIVERSIHYIASEILGMNLYSPDDPEYEYLQAILEGSSAAN